MPIRQQTHRPTSDTISQERKSAAVCRIVQLLIQYGYTYRRIAREANNCLIPSDIEQLRRSGILGKAVKTDDILSADAIRVFVDRVKNRSSGGKPPAGVTAEVLYIYISREKQRFHSFIGEYIILMEDIFLDPTLIPADFIGGEPQQVLQDYFIARSYQFLSRMMGIDYTAVSRSAKDLHGNYVCIRPSSRTKGKFVISGLTIQPRAYFQDVWEYRHKNTDEFGQTRETDGMLLVVDQHFIMLGDVAHGHGLEMLIIQRPSLVQANVIPGVMSTLSLDGSPISSQFVLLRTNDTKAAETFLYGAFHRGDCVNDLAAATKIGDKADLESILTGLAPLAMRLPNFTRGARRRISSS